MSASLKQVLSTGLWALHTHTMKMLALVTVSGLRPVSCEVATEILSRPQQSLTFSSHKLHKLPQGHRLVRS